jgi:hypothetical protein
MSRPSHVQALAVLLAVAACGGSSPEPEKPSPQPAAHADGDLIPMCERIFARKATCADDYLPALLDVRIELNVPPGIGDRVQAEGRDAILEIAHTELARDTEPATVATLCETTAAKVPPERAQQLLEQGGACEAAADCKAFATCAAAIDRSFIASGAGNQAAAAGAH